MECARIMQEMHDLLVPSGAPLRTHEAGRAAPPNLDLRDLKHVDAVAEHGSLTRAGGVLHLTQSVLSLYRERFPRVETRVVASLTGRPVPALLKGHLDLAVLSDPVRDRRLKATPIFRDELMAVIAPGHPWEGRSWVDAADVAAEHL